MLYEKDVQLRSPAFVWAKIVINTIRDVEGKIA
jgi:hypothetical protein